MKEQLDPKEITKIEQFCKDKTMFNAVKKVMLASIYSHGVIQAGKDFNPLQNGALSLVSLTTNNPIPDEQLGQHIRGVWAGINALENAYKTLETIKSEKESIPSEYNEAI